ncbi:tRNA (adenosine(37)-N6)-threonylcarbamoyltransferase complex ATPase subunit type 1 TsaE [Vagococcus xieshaowenii]|uniref:tRNA threonylcarbamoyladenosine biosynthesis protein TsaE n=1 Tax=Vagococcus xieshaowenii TaxID=2562451 RepID=A0AAJ5ED95_9ENTE|nr:tRNA (adenosine(37)-N6)-threonylcarbamoyltransferase complex ATPase subunit type 1 TsaE [Vagococcus xieshaowenii]QCA29377.1 tRNA (adenosine(37)-N6)-threonylcarbamoyltransferase complex ATPase subunit type 1 TsaE [Vagococcus xieshaowenii]TFZ39331.1 tRNA (adenosine(37)-N6)-threonylcarbamoyltransferase complex ATPase subunit type 1 TsaE [Vagococcus xieshaowenii]
MEKYLKNEDEMLRGGQVIGEQLQAGDVLVLTGELGAGKTTITKGIALGLGITQMIKSPTYTIVREYTNGRLPLYHMDVYRLGQGEGESFGLEEYFEQDGVVIMEWGNNLRDELPIDYIEVFLNYEGDGRSLRIEGQGANGKRRANELVATLN